MKGDGARDRKRRRGGDNPGRGPGYQGEAAEGLSDAGVSVKLFDINRSDSTDVIKEMLDAKGYLIGSSTHDNDLLHHIAGFLVFLKGLKPKNRIAGAFGSYGWAGGAVNSVEKMLKEGGIGIVQSPLAIRYMPDENETKRCYEYGRDFANMIKKEGAA